MFTSPPSQPAAWRARRRVATAAASVGAIRSRVVVRESPLTWGYVGAGVLLAIGIAAVWSAERHTLEARRG